MEKLKIQLILAATIWISLISPANASFVRTIDGIDYQWMELSSTVGLSRNMVEDLIINPNSELFGYRYASRQETEALLSSYHELPNELNVFYASMASGAQEFYSEFGVTYVEQIPLTNGFETFNNVFIDYNQAINSYFMHGSTDECNTGMSCIGRLYTYALDGVVQAWDPVGRRGADAFHTNPDLYSNSDSSPILGSLLVADITAVPLPTSVWLFSTGLIGLASIARKRKE